ncbi:MAG: hypothetical protein QOH74_825 [Gaiellales bacterium]|jgi:hypothetical protein|nr:hypothetical protein [Gaiellales bacterium]
MKHLKTTLSRGSRTVVLTVVALAAICGSVYAANGNVFGVRPLSSSTVTPPTKLSVSSRVSRSVIFRSHSPECTTFAYTTNKRSRNTITVSGNSMVGRGWQAAGGHTFLWCGYGPNGKNDRGYYTITVKAHTLEESDSSSERIALKR